MSEGAKDWWAAPLRFSKYDLQSLSLTLISLNQTKLQSELFKHKLKEGWQEKRNSQGGRERLCCWWWRRGLLVSGQWTTISWLGMTTAGTPQHNFYQHNLTQPTQSQCHSIPYQSNDLAKTIGFSLRITETTLVTIYSCGVKFHVYTTVLCLESNLPWYVMKTDRDVTSC